MKINTVEIKVNMDKIFQSDMTDLEKKDYLNIEISKISEYIKQLFDKFDPLRKEYSEMIISNENEEIYYNLKDEISDMNNLKESLNSSFEYRNFNKKIESISSKSENLLKEFLKGK